MAYQTGTATSPNDLLSTFATWLETLGWTRDSLTSDGAGQRYHAHKGAIYLNIKSCMNQKAFDQQMSTGYGWGLYLGSGYAGGSDWNAQAGGPIGSGVSYTVGTGMTLPSGSITAYHFFAEDTTAENVVVVVEKTSGIFTHVEFGTSIDKIGFSSNGQYFGGTEPGVYLGFDPTGSYRGKALTAWCPLPCVSPTYGIASGATWFVRVDVDAFTSKWVYGSGYDCTASQGDTGKRAGSSVADDTSSSYNLTEIATYKYYQLYQFCSANTQAVLLPIHLWVERDATGFSLFGTVPGIFWCVGTVFGLDVGETIAIGTDEYMVFPYFAIKKVYGA